MGRKKRSAATNNAAVQHQGYGGVPPPPAAFDQYGQPLPPPLPPQPYGLPPQGAGSFDAPASDSAAKRHRLEDPTPPLEDGERHAYPVKKYRPDSYYRSIEAFARYTKAHRMLDASYVRWTQGGGTAEKPVVFGIRIAGSFLSWGRGKTRDAAIDASIRAAFALVAAHGYDDFAVTDDCFTEEPYEEAAAPPPPPPPPPPPMGLGGPGAPPPPPLPPGMPPPLPLGVPPNFAAPPGGVPPSFGVPPPLPPSTVELIPQPAVPSAGLAVASAVAEGGTGVAGGAAGTTGATSAAGAKLAAGLAAATRGTSASGAAAGEDSKKKKSSSGLVFAGEGMDEAGMELSMEEERMRVPRYWTLVVRALTKAG
ncbi:hypothetical protein ACHAWF_005826 [Thalassiosira exigua]